MDYEEIRFQAKQHLHDLYPRDRQEKGIVCPLCGNGSGSDGDGVTFIKSDRNGNSNSDILHCFVCDFSGDVIALKAAELKYEYKEAAKIIAEQLGIPFYDSLPSHPRRTFRKMPIPASKPVKVEQVDYTEFFNGATKNLEKTDYYKKRGFSLETCLHFNLGFEFAWSHPKVQNAPKSPRFIIPTSRFSYLARDTRDKIPDYQQKYSKQKVGSLVLFNVQALNSDFVFLVEGEFDAISFHEIGFNAIALGSISNVNKFIKHIKSLSILPKCIILALDNDKGGKETTLKVQKNLNELGISNIIAPDIYGEHKDANEALVADRNSFQRNTESIVEVAKKNFTSDITPSAPNNENSNKTNIASTGNKKIDEAIAILNAVTDFSPATVFDKKILNAVAMCEVYHPATFYAFRDKCKANKILLSDFKQQLKPFSKDVMKIKKQEDKKKELEVNRELAKKRKEAWERQTIMNFERIRELIAQPASEERNNELISLILQNMDRTKAGTPKGTAYNFNLILNYDPYVSDCIGYDKSANRMVARRILPWRNPFDSTTGRTDAWSNSDDNSLWCYLNQTYDGLDSFKNMIRAVDNYARAHSFNPIQEYLESLPEWDGIPRADTFFIDALKVEDSYYARCVTRHWLLAAVARAFNPGCKWDYALVVKGDQGAGKSTAFARLGGKWFNDSIDSINGKDAIEQLLGSWIVELGEMQATKKSTNEAIKSFISRRVDKIRLPYLQRSEEYPRQAVFAGTTNAEEFLKDLTGSRRFLILIALANDKEAKERLAKIDKKYINQLWAEVLAFYKEIFKDGFDDTKLIPPQEVFEVAKQLQGDYTEGSELEGMIRAYLDILLPEDWRRKTMFECRAFVQNASPDNSLNSDDYGCNSNNHSVGTVKRTVVSAVEIAYELFQVDNPGKERALLRQINEILARIEGWKRTTWKRCGVYGQQRIAFERNIAA